MKPSHYKQFRREFIRRKAQTIYERLLDDADARRRALILEIKPLLISQLSDRDYETLPEQRRLRPVEYAAFPYEDKRYDYSASNTAGQQEATGWCFSGKHRVPVSELYIKGRYLTACSVCRERASAALKIMHQHRRAA